MNEYWRGKLDYEAKRCYSYILNGVRIRSEDIDCGDVSPDSVRNAYTAVYNDHPELFYLNSSHQVARRTSGTGGYGTLAGACRVITTPIYDAKEIRDCQRIIENVSSTIASKVNYKTTAEQKVLLVAEYLVRNTVYEIDNYYNQNAASALCFGRAQCSGISSAFKLLMDRLGVYCISLSGTATDEKGVSGPHAWNMVKIGNEYYHVDITFMLGANLDKTRPIVNIYLFYDDASIAKNHTWDRSLVPACTDKSRYLNDIEKNRAATFSRRGVNSAPVSGAVPCKHYSSLHQFKNDFREAIRKRADMFECYLDIGIDGQKDIARTIQNAIKMVTSSEGGNCGFIISVSADRYVNIKIEY